jgi:hypothetical protein
LISRLRNCYCTLAPYIVNGMAEFYMSNPPSC